MHKNAELLDMTDWGMESKPSERQSDWLGLFAGIVIGMAAAVLLLHYFVIAPLLAAAI